LEAISAVAYVKSDDNFGFVMGKSKVAPTSGHTIPRLELCSAVLATELWQIISEQLDLKRESVTFYSDSKVTLGYIHNETRRFRTYVCNRVQCIRQFTLPSQWKYVSTDQNPADAATRDTKVLLLDKVKTWLDGPKILDENQTSGLTPVYLVKPDQDPEVKPLVRKTKISTVSFLSRLTKFSSWKKLVRAIALLKHIGRSFHSPDDKCKGWHYCNHDLDLEREAERFILCSVQQKSFGHEIERLQKGQALPRTSPLLPLSPYLDDDGLVRMKGRVHGSKDSSSAEHPIIVPKGHVAKLLISHFHEKVRHQGRHFTEGCVRSSGYWIIGAKRLTASVIHDCVICRWLRGKLGQQFMADLPSARTTPSAPFSHVGVDIFGPWTVETRRTRGGAANSKRWAVLFTCLAIRAVHIEVIEEMTTSSFINAFRRFVSLRGPVKEVRSDRGTNFVGAAAELKVKWIFNPPHASHMGGSWERMIGLSRRILDSMLLDNRRKSLTHEVLCTFMAEVCAIINSRPITPVLHDPTDPSVLTPSTLLTSKFDHTLSFKDDGFANMYQKQWKHVQALSDTFWKRWKHSYLSTLETRPKWQNVVPNFQQDDLILLKDISVPRTEWPIGIVTQVFPSKDNLIRTVQVKIMRGGKPVFYDRPITELVLLEKSTK
jgi:hypothetical protein